MWQLSFQFLMLGKPILQILVELIAPKSALNSSLFDQKGKKTEFEIDFENKKKSTKFGRL